MNRTRLFVSTLVVAAVGFLPSTVSGQFRRSCGHAHPAYQFAPATCSPGGGYPQGVVTYPTYAFPVPNCSNGQCRLGGPPSGFAPAVPAGAPALAPNGFVVPDGSGSRGAVPGQSPRMGIGGRVREGSSGR